MNARQVEAMRVVALCGQVRNGDVRDAFPGVCAETVRADLAALCARGLLVASGNNRGRVYLPPGVEDARTRVLRKVLLVLDAGAGEILERAADRLLEARMGIGAPERFTG